MPSSAALAAPRSAAPAEPALAPGTIAVTGAAGYLGRLVVRRLAAERPRGAGVLALDLRPVPAAERIVGVAYLEADVRTAEFAQLFRAHRVVSVVHLAAVVDGAGIPREVARDIDVGGTRRVLEGCLEAGVEQLVVASSGAAYGYRPDGPAWLDEDAPLRGDEAFAYASHKRQVEELLARARRDHPELQQLILRPGTILGEGTRNQITNLFEQRCLLGLRGTASPFVFVWDEDVVGAIALGVRERRSGVFNLAGDGVLTLRDIASITGQRYLPLPPRALGWGLRVLARLGLTRYGPEQLRFLQYRPVLRNERLKSELGYVPRLTSRQTFDLYWRSTRVAS